jgi:serine/threonine protein phosphatase PrpC
MDVSHAIKVARLTDIGLHRDHNEDIVASNLNIGLLLLADGMGGYRAGEVASEIAALTIASDMTESMQQKRGVLELSFWSVREMLANAVAHANHAIYHISQHEPSCEGMGTTLVACVFSDNQLVVGHIGDSRLYLLRDGALTQVTQDHSLLQAQLDAGLISVEEAKNATHKNLVTRALGVDSEVELDLQELDVKLGDVFLLCSDGLTDLVEDAKIKALLSEAHLHTEQAAAQLIKAANEAGGKDNISVIIAVVVDDFAVKRGWVQKIFKSSHPTKLS